VEGLKEQLIYGEEYEEKTGQLCDDYDSEMDGEDDEDDEDDDDEPLPEDELLDAVSTQKEDEKDIKKLGSLSHYLI
jgi:hypothetical protein